MSKEDVSLISMHPFIRGFVLSAVQVIREKNFEKEGRVVVDADLIPKVSGKVSVAPIKSNLPAAASVVPKPMATSGDMAKLVTPIEKPVVHKIMETPVNVESKSIILPQIQKQIPTAPAQAAPIVATKDSIDKDKKYGKISPLLNDPSISSIECSGEGNELMITRAGQKQKTRISLNRVEIMNILETIADEAHIPLLEGVFRVSVKGFSINAVISDLIGSKFVIRKATAYGLLE